MPLLEEVPFILVPNQVKTGSIFDHVAAYQAGNIPHVLARPGGIPHLVDRTQ